ncbi:MAG: hybrid sensor histidine kinase/response regulator [Pseudomonadota bacterium]|nr:hybrid sensor histidine kinase/response regulator [Pseudomonadota bacterium]
MTTLTRILLIDDDASDRATVAAALAGSNLDYTLVEAETAEAGVAEAARQNFDCVLLDGELGAGADILARLTSPEGGRQAVITLTDRADQGATVALLRAGAVDALSRAEANSHALARAIRYAKARRAFVVELQAARDDAEEKSRALDRLNRQKTLILSIIAHDLRNPFQVMLGMSQLLMEAAAGGDPAATVRRAAIAHEAASQAHGLLESLVAWASLYMDARAAEMSPIDVDALFHNCALALRPRAAQKGLSIETCPTDALAISQPDTAAAILRNLVANALKFTPAGGRVSLSAARRGGRIVVSVADTGVGMSEAQTASLFHLERRSTSTGTDGERGAGLGLLLCRDLAEWIDASLEVESRLGLGTTFRLLLPAA